MIIPQKHNKPVSMNAPPADKACADVLADVRNSLGHDIDFANQQDREAIGNGPADHIRQTNGCDVAGDRAHGCPQ
jgi:hypothetical protein